MQQAAANAKYCASIDQTNSRVCNDFTNLLFYNRDETLESETPLALHWMT